MKEQNAQLQNIASQLDLTIKGQEAELSANAKEYEEKFKAREELYRGRIVAEEKQASRAEYDLAALRATVQTLQENLATVTAEGQSLREQLSDSLLPDPTLSEEVAALRHHVHVLEAERSSLLERAKAIDVRYKQGDLVCSIASDRLLRYTDIWQNEEEKRFINTLVQTSQAIHEQELITKGNELRRVRFFPTCDLLLYQMLYQRDNTIKELRGKIHILETSLAKHLKAQAQAQVG